MMHKDRLLRVREAMLACPENFDYVITLSGPGENITKPGCGTVGCVAGYTYALMGSRPVNSPLGILDEAEKLLGISNDEAGYLFYGDRLDEEPKLFIEDATCQDAIERIDYLLNRP